MTDHSRILELLRRLDDLLLELLEGLPAGDWHLRTIARLWTVKDIVAHLLDGNIRGLSIGRDRYFGESPQLQSYQDLVDFLNRLNADWVKAMKRVSPEMLVALHRQTGKVYVDYLASLDPAAKAMFSVAWAGEQESTNRFHIAREYTEKWLHQQQIRAAIGDDVLLSPDYFLPFIEVFLQALPHAYRNTAADEGVTVEMQIAGHRRAICRTGGAWKFTEVLPAVPTTRIILAPEIAWPLFSKSIRPEDIREGVSVEGDPALARAGLEMISVMA